MSSSTPTLLAVAQAQAAAAAITVPNVVAKQPVTPVKPQPTPVPVTPVVPQVPEEVKNEVKTEIKEESKVEVPEPAAPSQDTFMSVKLDMQKPLFLVYHNGEHAVVCNSEKEARDTITQFATHASNELKATHRVVKEDKDDGMIVLASKLGRLWNGALSAVHEFRVVKVHRPLA